MHYLNTATVNQSRTGYTRYFAFCIDVYTHWLAWADPDAQTPGRKGFGCRWASPPWLGSSGKCQGPSASEEKVDWESSLRVWGRLAFTLDQSSPLHSLNWLLICLWRHFTTSPTPFPGLSFAFYSCLPADCRSVPRPVASDAVRVAAALQLMGDLCWAALSLLISALVWRCFRQRA